MRISPRNDAPISQSKKTERHLLLREQLEVLRIKHELP